jgi:hypothetical protein
MKLGRQFHGNFHFSKENFTYVELWNSFRGMAFNLSLIFLIIAIIIMVRLVATSSFGFDWAVVSVPKPQTV